MSEPRIDSAQAPTLSAELPPDDAIVSLSEAEDGSAPLRPPETSYTAFASQRLGVYSERFDALAQDLAAVSDARSALATIEAEYRWASSQTGALQARDRFRAALSVLVDLLGQGWSWRQREHQLELAPPNFTSAPRDPRDVARQKEAIRAAMSAERV